MLLFLRALNHQGQEREFSCELKTIEASFDFLSTLVSRGNTLLTAHIVEAKQRLELPLEAFDGTPFSAAMQALQNEWQTVLNTPYYADIIHEERLYLVQLQVRQCECKIKHYERMIRWLSQGLQQKNLRNIEYRQNQLAHYQNQLINAQLQMRLRTDRLNQLLV